MTKSHLPVVCSSGALLTTVLFAATQSESLAQGCVAARGAGVSCHGRTLGEGGQILPPPSGWQVAAGYRWLHSDRHFVGDHEEEHRQAEGSEVINDSHFVDLNFTYAFTPRFSATLTIPFSLHDRSQVVRSNDVARTILGRYHTQSAGLGDVRLTGNMWVLDPETSESRWNILAGLGVDAPTGQADETDTFQVFDPATGQIVARERTVDQSIQPGDGGWGITADIYGYFTIMPRLNAYVNGAYTFTPEEDNGVRTFRNNPNEAIMSIADSYMGRGGLEYIVLPKYGAAVSLGGRIEGVPVHDAIGGSEGFRRPGYAISIEPGLSAMYEGWTAALYTPVAVYRNRQRSVPDRQTSPTAHGDAAFADFTVIFTLARSF
jgi:hypothetical protein